MELEEIEGKSNKSIYDRIYQAFWIVVAALVGISTAYYRDIFGLTGVLLAWAIVIIAFLTIEVIRLSIRNQKLEADEASKRRIKELFLTKLMDQCVAFGQDLVVDSRITLFTFGVNNGERIEFLAFSEDRFNIALMTKAHSVKFEELMDKENIKTFDSSLILEREITAFSCSDDATYIKHHYTIKNDDEWVALIAKANPDNLKDMIVNVLISRLPSTASDRQTTLIKK